MEKSENTQGLLLENISHIPRSEVLLKLKILGQSEFLLDDLKEYLFAPMKVSIRSEPVLPNFIVIRRGKTNGMDMYYVNDFEHFINKWKSWDKDFIIITDP